MTGVLTAQGIDKSFFGVKVLDQVNFDLQSNEIHALLGENGAGKSTLVKILTGAYRRDAGRMQLAGAEVEPRSVAEAQALGIGTVYQEVNLLDNLTVAENLYLGRQPRRFGLVDRAKMRRDARALLARYGIDADPDETLAHYPVAIRQIIAIARAVDLSGKVLFERHGVNLVAIARAGHRMTERLAQARLQPGDVVLLQGPLDVLPETITTLGLLPLAERELRIGSVRRDVLPVIILAVAMGLTAFGYVPVAVAFFGAALAMMLTGAISPEAAYEAIEWPILIMLGALIPVSGALQTTGGTDLIGTLLSGLASGLPAWGALALIMVAAMAVTPFLNNAATVLVMAPIAATFAGTLGFKPDAFLMAVAVGAGCDFLTPIGHQCNTLVMGPGGYRFGDYARLGAPLSVLVVVLGTPLILAVWPV